LFFDIVGYSKLLINEQSEHIRKLKEIVRGTEQFRLAEAEGKLLRLPTGDGGALVFRSSSEAPVRCAVEISKEFKRHPELRVRMGIHSGPVNEITDLNEQANIAGAGINIAQRVMDCGDAGHILLSKHVADDLEQYPQWRPHLHDLGECEVKHGTRVHVVNLYTEELGNPEVPDKFKRVAVEAAVSAAKKLPINRKHFLIAGVIIVIAIGAFVFWQREKPTTSATASPIPEKSIAVLPFENLSQDPDNAYFAAGIQDEILTRIAKIGALKVISRVSTQHYSARPDNLSEIAHQLGVANILEGSVQRAAGQVHVNVQLISAATDEHLWAESYDRKLENIFGVEAEVATAVADALKAKLTGAEQRALEQKPTNNPEAYDAYLRGITLWREDNYLARVKATSPLEEAVRLDPNFALAWAFLTRVNSFLYAGNSTPGRRAAAENSLATALRLQPDLSEVKLAHAFYQYWVLRDYEGARQSFEQLRTKLPNSADIPEALGMIARRQGRWNESRAYTDQAIALNPQDRILRDIAGWVRVSTRDFPAALRSYEEALSIWPDEPALIDGKAEVYQALGDLDQADALLEKLRPTAENFNGLDTICYQATLRRRFDSAISLLQTCLDQASSLPKWDRAYYRLRLGDLQRLSGNVAAANLNYSLVRDEFEQVLKEQPENANWMLSQLAYAYAGLGDLQHALTVADRAISLRPASKDALAAAYNEETRARIAARFGRSDLAIPILEHLLKTSYGATPLTPALLRLDPDFDPLRGDPRFQKLAAQAEPNTTAK
jgi:TolB-like protein/class 3 adenylate cyclase/Tfp pilus assembly protein PilF